jgi:hypothetical protein
MCSARRSSPFTFDEISKNVFKSVTHAQEIPFANERFIFIFIFIYESKMVYFSGPVIFGDFEITPILTYLNLTDPFT